MNVNLKNLNIAELNELVENIKVEVKARTKQLGEANRSKLLALNEGKKVRIIFKGEEVEAKFVCVTNSRFTVEIDSVKKSIQFDKLISIE